jgi:hypothetical protein
MFQQGQRDGLFTTFPELPQSGRELVERLA